MSDTGTQVMDMQATSLQSTPMQPLIALDIGGTKIASGLVFLDESGDIQHDEHQQQHGELCAKCSTPRLTMLHTVATNAQQGGAAVLERVCDTAHTLLEQARQSGYEPVGIGISSAGVIDPISGDVHFANEVMPGWSNTPLASTVAAHCGLPTKALNDVHAHALGEARYGAGKAYTSCLVVAVGTGIGGAYVYDHYIMRGAHDVAGSIGHALCPQAADLPCACGRVGHVETIAAGPGLLASYKALGGDMCREDGTPITGADVSQRADAGDRLAQEAQTRAGFALGAVLGSMCNMVDPACIILSGSVVRSGLFWHKALRRGFEAQAMDPVAATPLLTGELGAAAPLIGTAENFVRFAYRQ